jgi:hypothetical protein
MSPLVPYTEKGANFSDLSEPSPQHTPNQSAQHLLYSVGNTIRLHHDGYNREFLIAERPEEISALAVHDNRLVHAEICSKTGDSRALIFYTETDELIARRYGMVNALAVHEDRLIDAGNYKKIFYTKKYIFTGKSRIIAERPFEVNALATYKDVLIDVDGAGTISYTKTDQVIALFPANVHALAVHDGLLVNAILDDGWERILCIDTTEFITRRSDRVNALAVYKGRLIDAGHYGQIMYSATDEPIIKKEPEGHINALLPIDDEMANRLLELPGVIPLK